MNCNDRWGKSVNISVFFGHVPQERAGRCLFFKSHDAMLVSTKLQHMSYSLLDVRMWLQLKNVFSWICAACKEHGCPKSHNNTQHTVFFLLVSWKKSGNSTFLELLGSWEWHEWWCRVHDHDDQWWWRWVLLCVSPYRCLFVAPMDLAASWPHRDQLPKTDQAVSHGSLYQECCRSCISIQWKQPAFTWPTKRLRTMVKIPLSWNILRAWCFRFKLHVAEGGLMSFNTCFISDLFKFLSTQICFSPQLLHPNKNTHIH